MRVITKHLTKEILISCSFVMFALLALFAFFGLVSQASRIGTRYDIWTAIYITLLDLPKMAYRVMPIAALLGGVYTLSHWASTSEFTILRISGLSPIRLVRMLLVPGLILMVLTYALGEWVAPVTDKLRDAKVMMAANNRTISARGYQSGVWIRDFQKDSEGKLVSRRYINVKNLIAGDESRTGAWRVFEFSGSDGLLSTVLHAPTANYIPNEGWHMKSAKIESLPKVTKDDTVMTEKATLRKSSDYLLKSEVGPDILGVMTVKPENMGIESLYQYVMHLKENRQTTDRYEIAIWNKIFFPLAIFAMLAVAMPFAYLNARSGGMAIKIFIGVMVGVSFYGFNNIFGFIGSINTWPPILVSLTPTLLMLIATSVVMWLVEKR